MLTLGLWGDVAWCYLGSFLTSLILQQNAVKADLNTWKTCRCSWNHFHECFT